jgi:hypothetical protein
VLTQLSSHDYKFGQIDFRAEFISQPLADFGLEDPDTDDGDPFGGCGSRDHDSGLSSLNLPSFTDTYTTKSVITTIEPRAFGAEAEYENRLRAGGLRRHEEPAVSVARSFKTSFEALLQQHSTELKTEEVSSSSVVRSEADDVYGETSGGVDSGGHHHHLGEQQECAATVIIPPMNGNSSSCHRQQPMTRVGLSMVMMTTAPSLSCSSSARSTGSVDDAGSPPPPPSSVSSASSSRVTTATVAPSLSHLLPNLTAFDTFLHHHEDHGLRQRIFLN